jgi:hypothetical protein
VAERAILPPVLGWNAASTEKISSSVKLVFQKQPGHYLHRIFHATGDWTNKKTKQENYRSHTSVVHKSSILTHISRRVHLFLFDQKRFEYTHIPRHGCSIQQNHISMSS